MSETTETSPVKTVDNSSWSVMREAVRGTNRDLTQGPIGLAIFLLAVPMILEMSMESLFAVVDIFFVAKLGDDAIAIVGFTESDMALLWVSTPEAGQHGQVGSQCPKRSGC